MSFVIKIHLHCRGGFIFRSLINHSQESLQCSSDSADLRRRLVNKAALINLN